MSAIWGSIDLSYKPLKEEVKNKMEKPYHLYKIDSYKSIFTQHVYMGCGIQYLTKEAINEQLPIYDMQRNIYITADCILDNRSELLLSLCNEYNCNADTPDGTILHYAYLKWGENCIKYLRGTFSFVIYDRKKEKLLIYADHTFSRCIYYCMDKKTIYFSTLLRPILDAAECTFRINQQFICDNLSMDGLRSNLDPCYTPYEGIYKVEAGCYICISAVSNKIIRYWKPQNNNQLPTYKSAKDAAEHIRDLLKISIEEALRTVGNKGATLSSGLDSSTVCGIAASILKNSGQDLYTFTYIPISEYQYEGDENYIPNESKGVRLIAEMHKNIKAKFIDTSYKNSYEDLDTYLKVLEVPCKTISNMPAISNCYKTAANDNCKLLLNGGFGNVTISQGFFMDVANEYIRTVKLRRLLRLIQEFDKRFHTSRKILLKKILTTRFKYIIDELKYFCSAHITENTYINPALINSFRINKRLKKLHYNKQGIDLANLKIYRRAMYDTVLLSQIGEIGTKVCLYHGIIERDPTKDIRVIEYCSSLPMECYHQQGLDRWLVRGNMEKYVPKELLYDQRHRGLQSADIIYKIKPHWDKIREEITEISQNSRLAHYIDCKKIEKFLMEHRDHIKDDDLYEVLQVMYLLSLARFVN